MLYDLTARRTRKRHVIKSAAGVPKSRDEVDVRKWRGFVRERAWRYSRFFNGDVEEAESAAWLGFVGALDAWNPKKGALATIADFHIRSAINRAIDVLQRQNGLAIKDRKRGQYHMLRNPQRKQQQACSYRLISGDAPIRSDIENSSTVFDLIADDTDSIEDRLIERDELDKRGAKLSEALTRLDDRERDILLARQDDENTLEVLAARHNVSRERIRQIEVAALEKLRHLILGEDVAPSERYTRLVENQRQNEARKRAARTLRPKLTDEERRERRREYNRTRRRELSAKKRAGG